jgi:ATP-dependent helicase Lhr and Lhr-like helicase
MSRNDPCEWEHLSLPAAGETALSALTDPVRCWFVENLGTPTTPQRLAWPAIAAGKNLLLCAPTGTGKTLAAFLPILGELLRVPLAASVRCLYVAPLKALGNDVRKNLRRHLRGIRALLPPGQGRVEVGLRTGDTSAAARRNLHLEPPDVLLTTPESLALLLTQPLAGDLFGGLRWVVVDEVHALAANKRGADLALSLERLAALVGAEFQRIGLSATCTPLAEAACFLAGVGRPCAIAHVAETSPAELTVEPLPETGNFMGHLLDRLEPELTTNRSTLIFANTRNLAERLSWALRRRFPEWNVQIAVHHSSLAADRRRVVERRFKRGRLRAVVSSTSLELGIDIGNVDGVVLVHPPGGVVRLLQRVGRAGHAPRRLRRGLVLTATPAELLEAAVTAAAGRSGQCEPLRALAFPLDVLCQQLLGLAAHQLCSPDEAFALVRRAHPFHDLPRGDFDACVDYLSGRHADGRPWLPPRLRWQGDAFTIRDARTLRILRRNLGTILADEMRPVHVERPEEPAPDEALTHGQLVGEVSDAFAERLQPGTRFLLDGRCLEFRRGEWRTLVVHEVLGSPLVPRWGSEGLPLSLELARRLYLLRVQAAEALLHGPDALVRLLHADYGLDGPPAQTLVAFFQRQESLSEVPDAGTFLLEAVHAGTGTDYFLHTPLNRAGNDTLARVAVLRLARDRGLGASSIVADLGVALSLRNAADLSAEDWRVLLSAEGFDADLTAALADSETLRERFRRVALTGLMLLRNPLGRRRRVGGADWAERRLFGEVRTADPDFVLLRQALREVRQECCDAEAARRFLGELPRLTLRCRWLPHVSPFVESWTQVAAGPVESVESPADALRKLHAALTGAGDAHEGA